MSASNAKQRVLSFVPRSFQPPPLLGNPHFQTIVGSEALRVKFVGSYPRHFQTIRERFNTPDNDFFDVDFMVPMSQYETCQGIVILVHGLESNTEGAFMTKMATAYSERGFASVLVSFRGCSGEENLTPGAYHLGFTTDLNQFIRILHERYPSKKLYLSGFSLGGNVILKLLGELQDEAVDLNINGAVVTCVPFDPLQSQGKIDKGFNRLVYSSNFLSTLKKKAEREHKKFPYAFDLEAVQRSTSMGEFDDAYIAAIYNFAGKDDYYRKTGSKFFLSNIRVPAIAINALDDPFIEENSLPTANDIGDIAPVRLIYYPQGGHCGFISNKDSYRLPGQSRDDVVVPSHGWLADEMGRILSHLNEPGHLNGKNFPATYETVSTITASNIVLQARVLSFLSLSPIFLYWFKMIFNRSV